MEKKKYTIIHHISGESNLLLENIAVFDEICAGSKPGANINFVILSDMMQAVDPEALLPENLKYLTKESMDWPVAYLVDKGDNHKKLSESGEIAGKKTWFRDCENLAKPENLKNILSKVKQMYPADHYAYIYKGHGGPDGGDIGSYKFIVVAVKLQDDEIKVNAGEQPVTYEIIKERLWKRMKKEKLVPKGWGNAESEVFSLFDDGKPTVALLVLAKGKDEDDLSYRSLSQVLAEVFPDGLSYVLLDCCWGMSLENIEIFQKNTRYLIASPDESPASGIGYRQFGDFISRNLEFTDAELAKMLVANYFITNYADYYSPIKEFRVMGVSLACADTAKLKTVLPMLGRLFRQLDEEKKYSRLLNCAKFCRDHTYSKPTEYDTYNVDIVWFLENIVYKSPGRRFPDDGINLLCLEIIKEIKLMLLVGFLGTNYPDVEYGKEALGGRGLTFPFPKKQYHYRRSIITGENYRIFEEIGWKNLLLRYYEYLRTIDEKYFGELKGIITETFILENGVGPLKGMSLDFFIQKNVNDKTDAFKKIKQLAADMEEENISGNDAFKAVIQNLETDSEMTIVDQYLDLVNKPKWKANP